MTTPNQSSAKPQTKVETITVTIVTSEEKIPVTAKIGETLYDAIERAKAVDGYGACDGKMNHLNGELNGSQDQKGLLSIAVENCLTFCLLHRLKMPHCQFVCPADIWNK